MNNTDKKLLNRMYQDARIGIIASNEVLKKCNEQDFKKIIQAQKEDYDKIASSCEEIANANNIKLCDNNILKKMKQLTMINVSLFFDESDRHIAELMITGSVMGVLDIIKALYDMPDADKSIIDIGKKLQLLQENYVEKLKTYLEG